MPKYLNFSVIVIMFQCLFVTSLVCSFVERGWVVRICVFGLLIMSPVMSDVESISFNVLIV